MQDKILTKIHNKLLSQKKTIAVAESCTGGLLCGKLTKNPGASVYFLLGVVAYSNNSKEKILQIPARLISKYGAVSRQIAILMSKNIRKRSKADLGIGITGLAGPGGATVNKPVGTVFISLSAKNKNTCQMLSFRGSRQDIRKKTIHEALRLLCAHLSL
ncbi:MAG: CinA family protein [Candidatus Omnitrophica bacterium]|nr:CinA family protein [Candidatus Omnitrophota bacterium]MBU1923902.1 CinA family protein [Candidatus Omnitrophota bacterium]